MTGSHAEQRDWLVGCAPAKLLPGRATIHPIGCDSPHPPASPGDDNSRAAAAAGTIDLLTRVGLLLPRMPALGHDRPGGTRKGWAWVSPHTGLQAALQEVRGPR